MVKQTANEFLKFVFYSIVGAIIFLVVYSIWINPSVVTNILDNTQVSVKNKALSVSDDALVAECRQAFNECDAIRKTSTDEVSFLISDIKRFDNVNNSIDFYNNYGGILQADITTDLTSMGYAYSNIGGSGLDFFEWTGYQWNGMKGVSQDDNIAEKLEDMSPFVLVAVQKKVKYEGNSGVFVIGCNKNGELTDISKAKIFCYNF